MPRYPFTFYQGDALNVLELLIAGRKFPFRDLEGELSLLGLDDFDAIHASPPCQSYSKAFGHLAHEKPKLLERTRSLLERSDRPWVIENVVGAPMPTAAVVCGTGLGLLIRRHRLFEGSFFLMGSVCRHNKAEINPHRASSRAKAGLDVERRWRDAMGVGWMQKDEARQAIPPAYTFFIGKQLLSHLEYVRDQKM